MTGKPDHFPDAGHLLIGHAATIDGFLAGALTP
jgi:hypothetical protein